MAKSRETNCREPQALQSSPRRVGFVPAICTFFVAYTSSPQGLFFTARARAGFGFFTSAGPRGLALINCQCRPVCARTNPPSRCCESKQKQKENEDLAKEWMRKAELAVDKNQDDLARSALERHQSYQQLAASFKEQVGDQAAQVEELKSALRKLEQKLPEARAKSELLITQHRRSRAVGKARDAQMAIGSQSSIAGFERMKQKVAREAAVSQAKTEMATESLDDRFATLEKEDEIENLLSEVKARRRATG